MTVTMMSTVMVVSMDNNRGCNMLVDRNRHWHWYWHLMDNRRLRLIIHWHWLLRIVLRRWHLMLRVILLGWHRLRIGLRGARRVILRLHYNRIIQQLNFFIIILL